MPNRCAFRGRDIVPYFCFGCAVTLNDTTLIFFGYFFLFILVWLLEKKCNQDKLNQHFVKSSWSSPFLPMWEQKRLVKQVSHCKVSMDSLTEPHKSFSCCQVRVNLILFFSFLLIKGGNSNNATGYVVDAERDSCGVTFVQRLTDVDLNSVRLAKLLRRTKGMWKLVLFLSSFFLRLKRHQKEKKGRLNRKKMTETKKKRRNRNKTTGVQWNT